METSLMKTPSTRHTNLRNNIALFIAILFHVSGVIGILFTSSQEWFIQNTTLNLLLMAILIVWTQTSKTKGFFVFLLVAFCTGFFVEAIGVHTGYLFGNYAYGVVMGKALWRVPFLIGVNWFVIVYCCGSVVQALQDWTEKKATDASFEVPPALRKASFVVDGALLAVFFDFIMEPVAEKLGYWKWGGTGEIPFYNYLCWFLISCSLLFIAQNLKFNKRNYFAVNLFIIQLLFFLALRVFL